MRKEWQKPVLEVLDVKMTMHTATGTHFDDTYQQNTNPPTDGSGHMLILS